MSILMNPTTYYHRMGEVRFRSVQIAGAPVALRTRNRERMWEGDQSFVSIQLDNIPTNWFCWELTLRCGEDEHVPLYRYQRVREIIRTGKSHVAYEHCSKYLNACSATGEEMSNYFDFFTDRVHTPWKCYWPYPGLKQRCLTIHDLSWGQYY